MDCSYCVLCFFSTNSFRMVGCGSHQKGGELDFSPLEYQIPFAPLLFSTVESIAIHLMDHRVCYLTVLPLITNLCIYYTMILLLYVNTVLTCRLGNVIGHTPTKYSCCFVWSQRKMCFVVNLLLFYEFWKRNDRFYFTDFL